MDKLVEIKFQKTHPNAILPTRFHSGPEGDTGYDVFAVESCVVPAKGYQIIPIGLKLNFITPGYWIKVEGRSGLGFKHHIFPHFGIIDCGYRGDMGIKLYNYGNNDYNISIADRVAQLVIYKRTDGIFTFSEEETASQRGICGYGSTGK